MTNSSGTTDGALDETKLQAIAEASLSRQLEWIRAVENKLTIIVAVNTAMLATLAAKYPETAEFCSAPTGWLAAGGLLLIASTVECGLATFPRLEAPNVSLLYFGTIAAYSREDFTREFNNQTRADHVRDTLAQVHRNAQIARSKYGFASKATVLLMIGLPTWLLAILAM